MAQSRQRSHLPRNLLIGFLVLLILYTLAGFLLLPWWLERLVPEQLDQRMGWQAEITDIRTNPFTLTVEASGLSAADSGGEQVVGFDRLMVDMNFFQLVRGIAGFEAIQLDEPYVRVDLLEDYSVNFARDWQAANPEPAQTEPAAGQADDSAAPPKLYFGRIELNGGEMLFRDFTKENMAEFRVIPLDLTLNDLATWRREGQDSDYSLLAALGSQTIEWQGDLSVSPFIPTVPSRCPRWIMKPWPIFWPRFSPMTCVVAASPQFGLRSAGRRRFLPGNDQWPAGTGESCHRPG